MQVALLALKQISETYVCDTSISFLVSEEARRIAVYKNLLNDATIFFVLLLLFIAAVRYTFQIN